eukprot:c3212_g1_i1.p1 GENE.c3212_g1_i1~~c3212_g1_i1.p1  ORF type:complete len:203 (+),score=48.30 c3212_g1_i1:94-702(+)
MFQIIQPRKVVKTFKCAVCAEKQSVQKIFGRAEKAKDLRPRVMELNVSQGQAVEELEMRPRTSTPPPEQQQPHELSERSSWDDFVPKRVGDFEHAGLLDAEHGDDGIFVTDIEKPNNRRKQPKEFEETEETQEFTEKPKRQRHTRHGDSDDDSHEHHKAPENVKKKIVSSHQPPRAPRAQQQQRPPRAAAQQLDSWDIFLSK